jgi:hypothetical protein
VTFESDDRDRVLMDECRRLLPELRKHGEEGERFMQAAVASIRKHFNNGVHDKRKLKAAVKKDLRGKYGSFILLAIAAAVIHFLVVRFLEWMFPKAKGEK